MARTILGQGSHGQLVQNVQQQLVNAGFNTNGIDGSYGGGTSGAVNAYQGSQGLPATGTLDDGTWAPLMQTAIPSAYERALQVTASFEGHGFQLAQGNFDGAWLTWGIIGFTMSNGEVQKIINGVNAADATLVPQAFGDNAAQLLEIMQGDAADQKAWAIANTTPNGGLAEPWKTQFAAFGALPAVQQEQLLLAQNEYLVPAIATGKGLALTSELALGLCFDIHVQNGGISSAAMASINSQKTDGMSEADLLPIIANAVANSARAAYQADVRSRKMTYATGQGTVHGGNYVLDNWGLRIDIDAAELTS
jgi:hypothetical protein